MNDLGAVAQGADLGCARRLAGSDGGRLRLQRLLLAQMLRLRLDVEILEAGQNPDRAEKDGEEQVVVIDS